MKMNREQRRAQERIDSKISRSNTVEIPVEISGKIEDGEKFTIKGYKVNSDGTMTTDCKKGNETVWVAKHQG